MRWKFCLLLAFLPVLAACPVTPPVTPAVTGDDAGADAAPTCTTPAECACEAFTRLGCEEREPNCIATIEHVLSTRLTPFDPECVTAARTKAEARACPAVECP